MKRFVAVLLCIILASAAVSASAEDTGTRIDIICTSEYRGDFDPSDTDGASAPVDAAYLAALKADSSAALVIDCGNSLYGSPFSVLSGGVLAAELMAQAGFDCAVVGSGDLCFGEDGISRLAGENDVSLISAGLTSIDGVDDGILKEVGSVTVGIIGLTGLDGETSDRFGARELIEATEEVSAGLRAAGADVIIAAGSLGSTDAEAIFSQVTGVDIAVITDISQELTVSGTRVLPVPDAREGVELVSLDIRDGAVYSAAARVLTGRELEKMTFSEAAEQKKTDFEASRLNCAGEYGEILSSKLAENKPSGVNLPLGDMLTNNNLGWLAAESLRSYCNTDFALFNAGRIVSGLDTVLITYRNLTDAVPSFERLATVTVTPKKLYEILENAVSGVKEDGQGYTDPEGKFLQAAGFGFVYDPEAPQNERIKSVVTDGGVKLDRIDDKTEYTLVATENTNLSDCEKRLSPHTDFDAISEYIANTQLTAEFFENGNFERIWRQNDYSRSRSIGVTVVAVCIAVIALAVAVIAVKRRKNRA